MKSIIKVLLLSIFTTISYSQNETENLINKNIQFNPDIPEIVIKNTSKDFSTYIRDINVDPKVMNLQNTFLEGNLVKNLNGYDLVKNPENYSSFRVLLELKSGEGKLLATYNRNGKLTSVIENYENLQLPNSICHSIYKEYPGWQIVKDKYNYTQEDGIIIKKEYKITMTKDNKTKRIVVNHEGQILASR